MPIKKQIAVRQNVVSEERSGQSLLTSFQGNELFVAIVGPAGAGAGTAAGLLKDFFEQSGYAAVIIKASKEIRTAAENASLEVPHESRKSLHSIRIMQDRGDDLRKGGAFGRPEDHSAVARLILHRIAFERAAKQGKNLLLNTEIEPDGQRRAYIIDSLRHPAEVNLLRRIYQDAFTLIGIVCDPQVREKRIRENLFDRSQWGKLDTKQQVQEFIDRDENAPEPHGQHVADTFHEADFFVDNSEAGNDDLRITGMNDPLKRFVSLVTQERIIRPNLAETAMHQARSAQMRSACLSRQVGAALVDKSGNIVATGTNEVPRAGGGVYGKDFDVNTLFDDRCAFKESVFCSSNREQNIIINELIDTFPALLTGKTREQLTREIRKTRIGGLIEFSRAVHAEMDAILSASAAGVSPKACRLYVTTYPCHYCARHIVAAGIDEVQFIEPYPKSRATDLHSDAITIQADGWQPPSSRNDHTEKNKVLFRPFVGVAPRMYRRVFLKDRGYKDKVTGELAISTPAWGGPLDSYKVSYVSLETEIGIDAANGAHQAEIGA
ncbi:Deoxycytidylate deaminase-related protein [Neorhizobium galegae bv. orientalis]|nr:Deoxycytidylate deaminase-related protein [Neorhizobium galegae bv. orientalis]